VTAEKKYRVLVVDDEPDIAAVMKLGLEKADFEVEAFSEPLKALEHFKKGAYDLALLDIRMKPINGFELYRRILDQDNKVRVCFITAFEIYYDEFRRVFPKIKVDCFVRKPVTVEKLAMAIKTELERSSD
jgi:two-component system catabolic regulation response regulator CreB/two-component system response regulator ChvI